MTEPTADTWHRDVIVLRTIVPALDTQSIVTTDAVAAELALPEPEVKLAMRNLHRGGQIVAHVVHDGGGDWDIWASDVTRDGLERSGAWPTPDGAADRIIAALEEIEANTDDEDTRSRVRKILDAAAGNGKQILVGVAAAAITGQLPS
jgi:hypothetical protein